MATFSSAIRFRCVSPLSAAVVLLVQVAGPTSIAVATTVGAAVTTNKGVQAMPVRDAYPLVTTEKLFEARDFYARHFGFTPAFQSSWFVYLVGEPDGAGRGASLAFMHPDHPSSPPGPETFSGKGLILTIEVADAAAAHARLAAEGAPIIHPLTDEDWGQRRFMTRDPSGMLVDVVEMTAPKPGYWDRYPAPD